MVGELNQAIVEYKQKWEKLSKSDPNFFKAQTPTAVAWKVEDFSELAQYFNELCSECDQVHWGWVNERWLVTLHLKDKELAWGIRIVKLMQRRPGSKDSVGLDHIDFYDPENKNAAQVLAQTHLKWTKESNGKSCRWISVWFNGTEAKLRTDTVLEPCIKELQETQDQVIAA